MPVSTYRLQFYPGFGFDEAREVLPYLAALGVTDCYCSPIFTARPGSTHGYDVCNHNEINPEFGGATAFVAFVAVLKALGLGQILDFVPNHMGNDVNTNDWWSDVLENGPSSPFARFFDIDWSPVKTELKDRLLLPILGEPYGAALESGALRLVFERGTLALDYHGHRLPINPRRAPIVYETCLSALEAELGADHRDLRELLSILTALRNLPSYVERDDARIAERQREKEVARERLLRLVTGSPVVSRSIDLAVAEFNGVPGRPASFDRLHGLLELQAYRLASWRTAADEINYRRFFDVNQLAGLRVEEPQVFDRIHTLLLQLVRDGTISGIRLDHIDGLFDPAGYLRRLREACRRAIAPAATGPDEDGPAGAEVYIVAEKIVSPGEELRRDWPIDGTTGYTFLNDLNGIFVDARHAADMRRVYTRFTRRTEPFADVAYESRRLIASTALSSEFQVLAQAVNRLSEQDRRWRDFTLGSIRRALREVVACFPVYRTYISAAGIAPSDRAIVEAAIAAAQTRNPAMEASIFEFLSAILLPEMPAPLRLSVAMRFQQYTGPVQAKGLEDTAFYRYHALVSLNEVGGAPDRFGRSVGEFHRANAERAAHWPREMLATATHDTKRGEDARARINVLSEMPAEWRKAVSQWMRLNRGARTRVTETVLPDPATEYFLYQSLVGAWPAEALGDGASGPAPPPGFVERIHEYMRKAIKEAKVHTSWVRANRQYETAVATFVTRTLGDDSPSGFPAAFVPFARRVARAGVVNSLAQLLLKLVSPGVPDFYQGSELWDLSLVDPDNRRPVDFAARHEILAGLEPWLTRTLPEADPREDEELPAAIGSWLESWPDARIKMFLTAAGLRLRKLHPDVFGSGEYLPLDVAGDRADHVVACARRRGEAVVLAVAPRLTSHLPLAAGWLPLGEETWAGTRLVLPAAMAGRTVRNLLTGERLRPTPAAGQPGLPLSRILRCCPVALLWAEDGTGARS